MGLFSKLLAVAALLLLLQETIAVHEMRMELQAISRVKKTQPFFLLDDQGPMFLSL